eukprot:gene43076-58328_t
MACAGKAREGLVKAPASGAPLISDGKRGETDMKRFIAIFAATALCLTAATPPAMARMSDKDKAAAAAAAIAILGIAALAHNKHHYQNGYEPGGAEETAEFER